MCCRYVLTQDHAKTLLEKLGVLLEAGAALPATRHNIPPGGRIPAVRTRPTSAQASGNLIGYSDSKQPARDQNREFAALHWGLVPSWARDAKNPSTNARAETLVDKPTFRDALRSRRCLIPASGFYEWKVIGRARQPWLFRLRDEQPFAFAGLWETWRSSDGEVLESCAFVTTTPNVLMEPIHHRMPVILADSATWDSWLDPRIGSIDTLSPLFRPFPAEAMTATAVSPRVNSTRYDAHDCLAPADSVDGLADEPQLSLGF